MITHRNRFTHFRPVCLYLQKPATAEQKAWIVRQMDSSNETSYSLARKLGCSSSYIRKIMFRARHVSEVKKPVGRPKSLDAESLAVLQDASINRYKQPLYPDK